MAIKLFVTKSNTERFFLNQLSFAAFICTFFFFFLDLFVQAFNFNKKCIMKKKEHWSFAYFKIVSLFIHLFLFSSPSNLLFTSVSGVNCQ